MTESDLVYGRFISNSRHIGKGIQELPIYKIKKPAVGAVGHGGNMYTLTVQYETPRCKCCGFITSSKRCENCGAKQ